jgi:heme exporter protein D
MSFSSWSDFWYMGGYALYVWISYGLTLVVIGSLIFAIARRHRQLRRDIARRQRRHQHQQEVDKV